MKIFEASVELSRVSVTGSEMARDIWSFFKLFVWMSALKGIGGGHGRYSCTPPTQACAIYVRLKILYVVVPTCISGWEVPAFWGSIRFGGVSFRLIWQRQFGRFKPINIRPSQDCTFCFKSLECAAFWYSGNTEPLVYCWSLRCYLRLYDRIYPCK